MGSRKPQTKFSSCSWNNNRRSGNVRSRYLGVPGSSNLLNEESSLALPVERERCVSNVGSNKHGYQIRLSILRRDETPDQGVREKREREREGVGGREGGRVHGTKQSHCRLAPFRGVGKGTGSRTNEWQVRLFLGWGPLIRYFIDHNAPQTFITLCIARMELVWLISIPFVSLVDVSFPSAPFFPLFSCIIVSEVLWTRVNVSYRSLLLFCLVTSVETWFSEMRNFHPSPISSHRILLTLVALRI